MPASSRRVGSIATLCLPRVGKFRQPLGRPLGGPDLGMKPDVLAWCPTGGWKIHFAARSSWDATEPLITHGILRYPG